MLESLQRPNSLSMSEGKTQGNKMVKLERRNQDLAWKGKGQESKLMCITMAKRSNKTQGRAVEGPCQLERNKFW